jgi:hypothetical protein
MDEEIDSVLVAVRADTAGFDRDVAVLRSQLTDGLGGGADKAARSIGTALARAAGDGRLSFDTLKTGALKALDEIAGAALKAGLSSALGGSASAGLTGIASSLLGGLLGLPGRATGGPVSPDRPYMVGERGPELFVPTASGTVVPAGGGGSGAARALTVSIAVNAPAGDSPRALSRSSRQVARAVSAALASGR